MHVTVCPCVRVLEGEQTSQTRPTNTPRSELWGAQACPAPTPPLGVAQLCWDSASPAFAGCRAGLQGVEESAAVIPGGVGVLSWRGGGLLGSLPRCCTPPSAH